MAVGKAPTVNEPNNLQNINQPTYRPANIQPDYTISNDLNELANTFRKIDELNTKVDDYNKQTELYSHLNDLSKEAELNKWDVDEYKKKAEALISKYEFSDPDIRLQTERYTNIHLTTTAARLKQLQLQDKMSKAIASTLELGDKLLENVNDVDSYNNAIATINSNIDLLVKKGFLNPVRAKEIKDKYTQDAKKHLIVSEAYNNPNQFLKDVKAGKYDSIFTDKAEKIELIKAVKNEIRKNELEQIEQRKILFANMTHELFNRVVNQGMSISEVMKSTSIPAEVKSEVIRMYNNITSYDENNIKNYWDTIEKIHTGYFKSTVDLHEYIRKNSFTRQQVNSLYKEFEAIHLSQQQGGLSGETKIEQELLRNPVIKNYYGDYISGSIKSIMKFIQPQDEMFKSVGIDTIKKPTDYLKPETLVAKARVVFVRKMRDCVAKYGNSVVCERMAEQIANESVSQVMLPVEKKQFYAINTKILDNTVVDGKYKLSGDLKDKIVDDIFRKIVNNDYFNKTHDYDLTKIVGITNGQFVPITLKFKDDNGNEIKIGAKIGVIGSSLDSKLMIKIDDRFKKAFYQNFKDYLKESKNDYNLF